MASKHRTIIFIAAIICISMILSGCNTFDAFDKSLNGTDQTSLIGDGRIALDEGRYADALELFERSLVTGGANEDSFRGRASAFAGLAGFNMFKTLQVMQNGLVPPDSSATIFLASRYVKDNTLLEKAISDLSRISNLDEKDRLLKSLLVAIYTSKKIVEKYDTNFNGKLDKNDQIDFDTRDDKTAKWGQIFTDAVSSTSHNSLELAFQNMALAFNGRGENWILVSPVQGIRFEGTYTLANRSSILALSSFTDSLEAANVYFNNSETLFKQTLIALDGVE